MENNKYTINFALSFLIVSLVFIIPMNSSVIFAFGKEKAQDAQNMCSGGNPLSNPKDSLILSIVTLCLPGILEKVEDYKQIKYQTIQCYYNSLKYHEHPASMCDAQEGYRVCKYVVGELFALPPFAFLEMIKNSIADVLANPSGLLIGATHYGLKSVVKSCEATMCPGTPANWIASTTLTAYDITDAYQTITETIENAPWSDANRQDYSSGIDNIKKKMEKIVKSYKVQDSN